MRYLRFGTAARRAGKENTQLLQSTCWLIKKANLCERFILLFVFDVVEVAGSLTDEQRCRRAKDHRTPSGPSWGGRLFTRRVLKKRGNA
jgi:hypothetical protein